MKRIYSVLLAGVLLLSLCACGQNADTSAPADGPTWQEQYDLGIRYLSEGNYEEAIIAFTAAIEIDPKRPEAYIGLSEAYTAQGDASMAIQVLNQAKEAVGESDALLQAIEDARTVRRDVSDGEWIIDEYDENGKQTLSTWYLADGSVKSISEYTYNGDTYTVSTQYNTPDKERYAIEIYDAAHDRLLEKTSVTKPIPVTEHHSGGEWFFKYDYQGTQVTVTYIQYLWTVNGKELIGDDSVVYTMAAAENKIQVGGFSGGSPGYPEHTRINGITEYSPSNEQVNKVEY